VTEGKTSGFITNIVGNGNEMLHICLVDVFVKAYVNVYTYKHLHSGFCKPVYVNLYGIQL